MDELIETITPLAVPPEASVSLPGSKSITNRALLCAAMASGTTRIEGALFADDTEVMLQAIVELGADVFTDQAAGQVVVTGTGGGIRPKAHETVINARMSGTTSRFLIPVAATATIPITIDGHPQLRSRPFGDIVDAVQSLGAEVNTRKGSGGGSGKGSSLPLVVQGPFKSQQVTVAVDRSSQFLSGLMLAGPLTSGGLHLRLKTTPVSRPYIEMTANVMRTFGADVKISDGKIFVAGSGYKSPGIYQVEPDASAASYFWAAAAITGGTIQVTDLNEHSIQGDVAFVSVLEGMGATVETVESHKGYQNRLSRGHRDQPHKGRLSQGHQGGISVTGGSLRGGRFDLSDLSDTVPTLAVVAALADGSTTIQGIGFIRAKESDRIAAVVTELRRCGINAYEHSDGFTVAPVPGCAAVGAQIETYDDHRIAMAFSILGLVVPNMEIKNPGCVTKTFPGFFEQLEKIRSPRTASPPPELEPSPSSTVSPELEPSPSSEAKHSPEPSQRRSCL